MEITLLLATLIQDSIGNYDFLLMKLDESGNIMWSHTYGGAGTQEAHAIVQAPDGYVLIGDIQNPGGDIHAWVVKVDWNGIMLWNKTVGGRQADSPSFITSAQGGGYLVCGFTFPGVQGTVTFGFLKLTIQGKCCGVARKAMQAIRKRIMLFRLGQINML